MPVTKSAEKALRVSQRKRVVNLRTKRKYKAAVKAVRDAKAEGDFKKALELLPAAYRELDLATKKKVIHKNKVARLKSQLSTQLLQQ